MNDEFKNNEFNEDDNEVVDSIPEDARPMGEEEPLSHNNNNGYNRNVKTKVIIENGPPCIASKIAFMIALGSVIFCFFPTFSIICALLGAGIGLICIANGYNGRIVAVFAVLISIFGAVLAALSSFIIMLLSAFIHLFI